VTSLWYANSPTPRFEPLRGTIKADAAVVGAGITGLTAALLLQERGLSVVVLDKDSAGAGESGKTTAHLTVALDARYHYVRRKYSVDEAKLVADASRASLEKIAELVGRHAIQCHFKRVPGYFYTEKRKQVAGLKSEAVAARESGLDAQWTSDVPLPFETRGAVLFPNQAQLHPGEYLAALADVFTQNGGRIYERTLVTGVKDGVVTTESGEVNARAIFLATNVPIAGNAEPYRTYVMAFEADADHPDGLFWDTADPYHYTRWQETDAGAFLIVGGEDHRVGDQEDTEGCFARLLAYAREHFRVRLPSHRWSGQVIEPHGGLPLIGGSGNIYISTGYSGQGMTFGTLGAMMVADFITGVDNPYKEVFSPTRANPSMTAREFIDTVSS
jgi:glycine/D-amino acid oxidase-like deaminating enzyme